MLKSLFLITDSFPYGKGESFLETEILFLAKEFKHIYIIPNKIPGRSLRYIGLENVTILPPLYPNRINSVFKIIFNLNDIFFILKELKKNINSLSFPDIFRCVIIGLKTRAYTGYIKKMIRENESYEKSILYFYWANIPANTCILLSKKVTCVVRYHGGDLYEELPEHHGKIFYRSAMLEKASLNIFISQFGYSYVKSKYKNIHIKYIVSRLSVLDFGHSLKSHDAKLRILTCSNVTLNKRVQLVLEALQRIKFPVEWTHIGDGPLLKNIINQSASLPANIHAIFLGQIPNSEVRKFFIENSIDLFINVSESEGVPVSIMEALSAGVPVMATNVGGTGEIVDNNVGQLLSKDISPENLSETIKSFYYTDPNLIEIMRFNARMRFEEFADASSQYSSFAALLSKVS